MVRLRIRRIMPRNHIRAVSLGRMCDQSCTIAVVPHKFCRSMEGQIQEVMEYQDLPIALRPSTNANRRSTYLGCNQSRDFPGNSFKHNTSHTSAVQCHSVAHELLDIGEGFSLHFVTA